MIGLIIIAHGALATALIQTVQHVLGEQAHVIAIAMTLNDTIADKYEELATAIQQVNQGYGVVIMTDMFGGTPSNLAVSFVEVNQVEVLAGVNVPLLLKFFQIRHQTHLSLHEVVSECCRCGQKYIKVVSELLNNNVPEQISPAIANVK